MSLVLIHQKLGFSAIHWGHPCWQHYDVMRNSIWCESPAKVPKIIGHMNVVTIWYSTFMKHQKKYLHAAVERTYRQQQSSVLDSIKAEGKELILGRDGRCDSPGHSAKYGSYSLMDLKQNKFFSARLGWYLYSYIQNYIKM